MSQVAYVELWPADKRAKCDHYCWAPYKKISPVLEQSICIVGVSPTI